MYNVHPYMMAASFNKQTWQTKKDELDKKYQANSQHALHFSLKKLDCADKQASVN